MSSPEPDAPAPAPDAPAADAPVADVPTDVPADIPAPAGPVADPRVVDRPVTDAPAAEAADAGADAVGPAADSPATDSPATETAAPDAPAPDGRVELTKPSRDTEPPAPAEPAAAPAEPAVPVQPAEPARPVDPWAVPDPAAARAAADARAWAGAAVPPVPPPAATGWAAVPPGALSGFQPGYAYPQAPEVTNGFAVAALITGLLCMWPLALVFGTVALVQIPKRNERGRGMAVSGVVFGVLGVLTFLMLVIGALAEGVDPSDRAGRPPHLPKAPPGSVLWSALKAGDCYNPPGVPTGDDPEGGDQTVAWVLRVPCAGPHFGEVAGTVRIPDGDGPYPGESGLRERAATLCDPVLDEYALDYWAVPDGMEEVYLYPSRANWKSGERAVTCTYEDRYTQHRGSVRTDRAALTPAQLGYLEAARSFNAVFWKEPDAEVADANPEYRAWARQMADASRKEAEELSKGSTVWPEAARPKVAELVAAQREAAAVWDTAAKTTDGTALEREVRRAKSLVAKSAKASVEVRRELGLSTGEQVGDIQT
ncbi:DUF4190 domain-containing protein [Kitasatospora sp. NPDC047058]|uniref:DUF4190 domain-containing protein n=1 Tax=Kitasatospora sp. NPDC047058 TaxID=3155620 RepID=UPI0033F98974